ncbi:hypothetical protein [Candidatus Chlorohelix sp.]|uniref:hypothetical protein n=1 Tax=Candidatus Chlorohelix sp. TaxID=3139201 RepID=UPI00306479A0
MVISFKITARAAIISLIFLLTVGILAWFLFLKDDPIVGKWEQDNGSIIEFYQDGSIAFSVGSIGGEFGLTEGMQGKYHRVDNSHIRFEVVGVAYLTQVNEVKIYGDNLTLIDPGRKSYSYIRYKELELTKQNLKGLWKPNSPGRICPNETRKDDSSKFISSVRFMEDGTLQLPTVGPFGISGRYYLDNNTIRISTDKNDIFDYGTRKAVINAYQTQCKAVLSNYRLVLKDGTSSQIFARDTVGK